MDFSNLFQIFDCAVSNNLKYPKLRFQLGNQVLVVKLAGDKSRYHGDIMLTNDASYGSPDNKYFGRIERRNSGLVGGRDLTPEIEQLLQRIAADPVGVAAEMGKLSGHCVFCTKQLTDPTSAAYGYGAICARKFGLPYETRGKAPKQAVAPEGNALVNAVREHARKNYNQDGWDYVVETMDRIDIADVIGQAGATTPQQAIEAVGKRAKLWNERREDSMFRSEYSTEVD